MSMEVQQAWYENFLYWLDVASTNEASGKPSHREYMAAAAFLQLLGEIGMANLYLSKSAKSAGRTTQAQHEEMVETVRFTEPNFDVKQESIVNDLFNWRLRNPPTKLGAP